MNIYPEHFESKIGFDQIRELLKRQCVSPMGEEMVDRVRYSTSAKEIHKLIDQVMEFKSALMEYGSFPAQDYFDIREHLLRLSTPGSFIEPHEMFLLRAVLHVFSDVRRYLDKMNQEAFPEMTQIGNAIRMEEPLLIRAIEIMDDKGNIRDNASSLLHEIRSEISAQQRAVLRATKKAFEQAKKSGWVPENSEITIRNGRSVIPINASDKRSMPGIIHDESATGQTVFVETSEATEINNAIIKLEGRERREIIRILTEYTNQLRLFIPEINQSTWALGVIDLIRAKTQLANQLNATKPIIDPKGAFILRKAVHPLLFLSHKAQHKLVVPLDLVLESPDRILLISGPNAGGKSVCLKTIGLLQYMLQCGLPVSASPDSSFRIFKQLFIDIGDEQSLENDLSTYSSHLLNMKFFLEHANTSTLILIDEFGTGTEPQLGGAIAEATLEALNRKGTFGVITTHYTNLKLLAEKTKGLMNGAMLYDTNSMQPLYMLQTGKPGSSFAFEIAGKIGFPEEVIQSAKHKIGGKHVRFDQQLQQLETEKILLDRQKKKVADQDADLQRMMDQYEQLSDELSAAKKLILSEARREAAQIISRSNALVEKTIREIKESEADKNKTRSLRNSLEQERQQLTEADDDISRIDKEDNKNKPKPRKRKATPVKVMTGKIPAVGDMVRIRDTKVEGQLTEIKGKSAILMVNDMIMNTDLAKLEVIDGLSKPMKTSRSNIRSIMHDINQKVADFSHKIDLRGKRADEAIPDLARYIDECILLSVYEVDILHGKGNGILRELIREYLRTIPEIGYFGDAPLDQGGAGITHVSFRR